MLSTHQSEAPYFVEPKWLLIGAMIAWAVENFHYYFIIMRYSISDALRRPCVTETAIFLMVSSW